MLIKRAALGNLKASFHCTHWHRFFPSKKAFFYLFVSPVRKDFFSKTYPSFLTVKEGVFLPLRLSCKESSTFLTKPLFPQEREDVTALRCSEPLRSKVGGPSKVYAMLCGMGPPYYKLTQLYNSISTSLKYNFIMKGAFFDNSFRSILLNQVVNKFSTLFRYIWTQCYFKLIKYIVL